MDRNVFSVANYILDKYESVTTMKLQKLVYYCQAWSLVWDGKPLFEEEFQAWANGPVCPELYKSHRNRFEIEKGDIPKTDRTFAKEEIETMDKVLKYYGDKAPHLLSNLTHEERPWKEAREGIPDGEIGTKIISKESMQDYYGGLK
ncbi:MAG: Panacea domain-containing protein [Fusobacteriaceae bacterium]